MKAFRDPVIDDEIAFSHSVQTTDPLVERGPQVPDCVFKSVASGSLPGKCGVILEVVGDNGIERFEWAVAAENCVNGRDNLLSHGKIAHAPQR
jgi:hypothetical protein